MKKYFLGFLVVIFLASGIIVWQSPYFEKIVRGVVLSPNRQLASMAAVWIAARSIRSAETRAASLAFWAATRSWAMRSVNIGVYYTRGNRTIPPAIWRPRWRAI